MSFKLETCHLTGPREQGEGEVGPASSAEVRFFSIVEEMSSLEPECVSGVGHLGQTGVDEWASAVLEFPNGVLAKVSCSIMAEQNNTLRTIGSQGRIEVKDFWFASGHTVALASWR